MKKILIALVLFLLTGPSFVHAIQVTELVINSVEHQDTYRWDTIPNGAAIYSPIGVSASFISPGLLNNPDKSIAIDLSQGDSIYLFTESFPGIPDLFFTENYTLNIKAGGNTYSVGFGFSNPYGDFIPPESSSPFTLSFKGFTNDLEMGDLVRMASQGNPGLSPDQSPDAIYELKYFQNSVPEPASLLLVGSGFLALWLLGRKRFLLKKV